jgi:hypothetical protein
VRLCGSFLGLFPLVRPFLWGVRVVLMPRPWLFFLLRWFFRLLLVRGVVVVARLLAVRLPVFVRLLRRVAVGFLFRLPPVLLVCCLLPRLLAVFLALALVLGLLWLLRLVWGFLAWFFFPLLFLFPLAGRWLLSVVAGFRFALLRFLSCPCLRSFWVWSSSASILHQFSIFYFPDRLGLWES